MDNAGDASPLRRCVGFRKAGSCGKMVVKTRSAHLRCNARSFITAWVTFLGGWEARNPRRRPDPVRYTLYQVAYCEVFRTVRRCTATAHYIWSELCLRAPNFSGDPPVKFALSGLPAALKPPNSSVPGGPCLIGRRHFTCLYTLNISLKHSLVKTRRGDSRLLTIFRSPGIVSHQSFILQTSLPFIPT